jgi:aspartate/methionine/tyrosine aminotransferase
VKLVPYCLAYDGAWHVDLDSLRRAVTGRTRAVLSVAPNNPTGSYLKKAELEAIAALGLPIVSDEVFASYPLREDPQRALTALEATDAPLVFALGGLSKLAGLPQVKLAWMVVSGAHAHAEAALARLDVIADAFLSVGSAVQHALPSLLESRAPVERAIRERTRTNLETVRTATRASAASVLDVEGGWYVVLRVPRTQPEEAWALALLEEDGVIVHPGHFFDFEDEAYLVVSLLTPEESFSEGVRRVVSRVESDTAWRRPGSLPR